MRRATRVFAQLRTVSIVRVPALVSALSARSFRFPLMSDAKSSSSASASTAATSTEEKIESTETKLVNHVLANAKKGDSESVLNTIDKFW